MRNTGTLYDSAECTPTVLPELAELLPLLTAEQLAALEADLLQNGCYAPIIVDENLVVIDGHNRLRLCEKHGIPYKLAVFAFDDLLEAKRWALDTQKGRRNLDKWELGKIALKLKPDIEARAKANQSAAGGDKSEQGALFVNSQKALSPVNTTQELADTVGIGHQTMSRVMQIDEHAPAVVKNALDNGDLSINQGYHITRQVQDLPPERQDEVAAQAIAEAKRELRALDAEADRRHKIAGLFCKAFEKAVLLTPTEENVRIWTECTRMRPDEIADSVKESRELAVVFSAIGDILEAML
ncbi:MAG: ParB N-terminal domain-containing protein [Oscillospiraceae bacterium]|nr:ParB N-terminal domain-containing protein [Oscillospiraceae bacterium]